MRVQNNRGLKKKKSGVFMKIRTLFVCFNMQGGSEKIVQSHSSPSLLGATYLRLLCTDVLESHAAHFISCLFHLDIHKQF